MVRNFEYMTNLQYEAKSLKAQVAAFQSGEKYRSMKADLERQLLAKDREIQALKMELAASRRETATVRKTGCRYSMIWKRNMRRSSSKKNGK